MDDNSDLNKTMLAGLTNGTVLVIKGSGPGDLTVTSGGPDDKGKYAGWIVMPNGRPLVSSRPAFDSKEAAECHMRLVIEAAREIDLNLP
jgi:hypothetical protein